MVTIDNSDNMKQRTSHRGGETKAPASNFFSSDNRHLRRFQDVNPFPFHAQGGSINLAGTQTINHLNTTFFGIGDVQALAATMIGHACRRCTVAINNAPNGRSVWFGKVHHACLFTVVWQKGLFDRGVFGVCGRTLLCGGVEFRIVWEMGVSKFCRFS